MDQATSLDEDRDVLLNWDSAILRHVSSRNGVITACLDLSKRSSSFV